VREVMGQFDYGKRSDTIVPPWADRLRMMPRGRRRTMDLENAKSLLANAGLKFSEQPLLDGHGTQLRVDGGPVVTVYHSGKCVLGGKKQELIRALFENDDGFAAPAAKKPTAHAKPENRKVFIVYGHDEKALKETEGMLLRWGLEPLILGQLPSGGKTIIEKLEHYREDVGFAVVIATPDDEGHEREKPEEKLYRARQNVVLELGMMLAVLGRPKVAILMKSDVNMEKPSDIQGLLYIPWKETVADGRVQLAQEMNSQGIRIDVAKL
jgi:predicted nucleotide-binding protein